MARRKRERVFGDRDFVIPTAIGVAFFTLLSVAMMTVGDRKMGPSTFFLFAGVCIWFSLIVVLLLLIPIMIGVSDWPLVIKLLSMSVSISVGVAFIVISGVLMTHFSLPN